MEPKYLKLTKGDKDIYFRINNIKKYYSYSAHGVKLYDYDIIINDMYVYDNIKKEYYDIEENNDVNHISYFYYGDTYCTSLHNAVKEILLKVITNV